VLASFILIRPTVWLQYTNVTDKQDRQTRRQTYDFDNTFELLILFYKRYLMNIETICLANERFIPFKYYVLLRPLYIHSLIFCNIDVITY